MKVDKIEENQGHVTYEIHILKDDFLKEWNNNITKLSQTAKIPGFRPGHIPSDVIEQRTKDPLLKDMLDLYVKNALEELKKDNVVPIGQPHIHTKIWSMESKIKDSVFTLDFDVFPTFVNLNYSEIQLTKPIHKPTDQDIDEAIENLLQSKKVTKPLKTDRIVQHGDQITFDFLGKIKGEPFEGGKAEDYKLEIGSKAFIPGFEDQLIGKNKNTPYTIMVPFPEDYPVEHLKGQEAHFEVTIKEIEEFEQPLLDKDFAVQFGASDVQDLRQRVSNDLTHDFEHMSFEILKVQLMNFMIKSYNDIKVPKETLNMEIASLPEKDRKDEKKVENIERRLLLSLAVAYYGRQYSIEISEEDYKNALMAEASKYRGSEAKVLEYYQKNPQQAQQLIMPVFENKVFKHMSDLCSITDEEVDREALNKKYESSKEEIAHL